MNERLTILREFLVGADLSKDDVFAHVVRCAVDDLGLTPGELGNALSVSRPTVERWMGGVTAPHPLMREPIRRFMMRKIARQT